MAWYEIAVEGDAGAWERLLAEQEAGTGQRAVRGPEVPLLHAPVHCYAYRAWGTVSGPFPGVQELHRQLHKLPFVYEEKLELAAQPVDPADLAPGAGSLKG